MLTNFPVMNWCNSSNNCFISGKQAANADYKCLDFSGLFPVILLISKALVRKSSAYRSIFVWPWKTISVSVRHLFHLPLVKKFETEPHSFPAKENPNMDKASFDCSIVLLNTDWRQSSRKCLMFAKPTKSRARFCLLAKPIKLPLSCSFVVFRRVPACKPDIKALAYKFFFSWNFAKIYIGPRVIALWKLPAGFDKNVKWSQSQYVNKELGIENLW